MITSGQILWLVLWFIQACFVVVKTCSEKGYSVCVDPMEATIETNSGLLRHDGFQKNCVTFCLPTSDLAVTGNAGW